MKNAKKEVQDALASTSSTPTNQVSTSSKYSSNNWKPMSPDGLQLPKWESAKYEVADPLNPPSSLPQISDQEYEARTTLYKRAINAVKLTGSCFDLYRERYNTEGKYYKAVTSGVIASSDFSKLEGSLLDYQATRENVSQKQLSLGVALATTQHHEGLANHTKKDLEEKLKQAQIKSESERLKTHQAIANLKELKSQLGIAL
jgi:hypothetical protein